MWYKFSQDQISIFNNIRKMRDLNKYMSPELEEARQNYINNALKLTPVSNMPELEDHWKQYTKSLSRLPYFQHSQQDYDSWRQEHPDNVIENMYLQSEGPKASLQKEFESSDESDFESWKSRKLESVALKIYNAQLDAGLLGKEIGIRSEEENPLLAFKDVRKQWANQVAEHYKNDIPVNKSAGTQTVTLFVGYPGAGKSRYIEPESADFDNPVRMTNYGILVDPDEYQRDLAGYAGGAGSQNTLVYAISVVKPEILKTALERGNDVVIPMVGGSPDAILNEVVSNVVKGYKVRVVVVPTDLETSHKRSLQRALQPGNRLIAPTATGDPVAAFNAAKQMVEEFSDESANIFVKKLLAKLGLTASQIKKMGLDEKHEIYDKYKNLIEFEAAR